MDVRTVNQNGDGFTITGYDGNDTVTVNINKLHHTPIIIESNEGRIILNIYDVWWIIHIDKVHTDNFINMIKKLVTKSINFRLMYSDLGIPPAVYLAMYGMWVAKL